MGRGVDRVQLIVECPNTVPLELEVQEPVDILEEVLEPIRWRWLSRQPVDVSWVMFDYPPELELLVLTETQLLRPQVVDLVLDQLPLVPDVVVLDWNELIGLVGVVVQGPSERVNRKEVLHVVLVLIRFRVVGAIVVFIVMMYMCFGIGTFRNDDVEVRDFLVVSCSSDLLLGVIILFMIIFGRIVLGIVRGIFEVRLLAPGVVVVGLVVEDVGVCVGVRTTKGRSSSLPPWS